LNIAVRHEGNWVLLTNEKLQIGDAVFPMIDTYRHDGVLYVTGMMSSSDSPFSVLACRGWPSEPHTIADFYTEDGILCVHTDKGNSPAERYFKLKEKN